MGEIHRNGMPGRCFVELGQKQALLSRHYVDDNIKDNIKSAAHTILEKDAGLDVLFVMNGPSSHNREDTQHSSKTKPQTLDIESFAWGFFMLE